MIWVLVSICFRKSEAAANDERLPVSYWVTVAW